MTLENLKKKNDEYLLKSIADMLEYDKQLCYKARESTSKEEQLDTLQKLVKRLDGERNLVIEYMESIRHDSI